MAERDGATEPTRPQVRGSRAVARLMDDLVRIPGTNIGFGLDSVIGLVPGLGDSAGAVLSGMILLQAVREGVPMSVLLRMVANIGVDTALGYVPVVGDLGDVAFRSNRRNVRLLDEALADPDRVRRRSLGYLLVAGGLVLLTVAVLAVLAGLSVWLVYRVLTGR